VNVERKLAATSNDHEQLREAVRARKQQLDERHGLQRFENEVHDFEAVCERMQVTLSELQSPRDLTDCADMLKRARETEQEFKDQVAFDHAALLKLGSQLSAKQRGSSTSNGGLTSVDRINALLGHVTSLRNELGAGLLAAQRHLATAERVLKFKQDANRLDVLMHEQEGALQYEYDDMGSSAASVAALNTRHEDFVARLSAQDEKLRQLGEQLSKMDDVGATAEELSDLRDTYDMLAAKRQRLKLSALERKLLLKQAKEFYEFKIKCDDLEAWCEERRVLIQTYGIHIQNLEK
jgi:hypothetical protein